MSQALFINETCYYVLCCALKSEPKMFDFKFFLQSENVDVKKDIRTRGSISKCLLKRNESEENQVTCPGHKNNHVTGPTSELDYVSPWYEQEVYT